MSKGNEDFLNKKIDLIFQKLEKIEKHLGIEDKTIYDNTEPSYSV